MGDLKKTIRDKFNEGKAIGGDPSLTPSEAMGKTWGAVKEEYATAANYTEGRAQRKKAVAKQLHDLRADRKLTQQEVSQKTGINVVTLSGYEIGKNEPNMEALVRLANVYEVTLDFLMCRSDEPAK